MLMEWLGIAAKSQMQLRGVWLYARKKRRIIDSISVQFVLQSKNSRRMHDVSTLLWTGVDVYALVLFGILGLATPSINVEWPTF